MRSNFTFLTSEWRSIHQFAFEAEKHAVTAPVTSAFYSRLTLELTVNWLYQNDQDLYEPYQSNLEARLREPSFVHLVPPDIYRDLKFIRKNGNRAAHEGKILPHHAMASVKFLHRFLIWFTQAYSIAPPSIAHFDEAVIPTQGNGAKTLAELNKLQEHFELEREKLKEERERLLSVEKERDQLREQLEQVHQRKQERQQQPVIPPPPYSEKETRLLFIDIMLREAGWNPDLPTATEYPVVGLPRSVNPSGKGWVDYVLWGDDGLPLAILEAKKTIKDIQAGQNQAKLYANCLETMTGQRPVIFYSNGFETEIWDDQFYPPTRIEGVYTQDELELLIDRRASRKDLREGTINESIVDRAYHREAIQRVSERLVDEVDGRLVGKSRAALLVMATGAGKTRLAAALVDLLTKSNWVKRVLFLADRNALVSQAKRTFNEVLPHLTSIDLTKEKESDATRLVFSTYPTMMNQIDSARTDDQRQFGVGHFDLIIIDEAHRSVYQKYQAIFDYFDAIRIGLTATPKAEADKDTYDLFDCEMHNPTFAYELEQAVQDRWLVPPKGKKVDLGFMKRGIKYKDLTEEEKIRYEETFRDEQGNFPREISSTAINQWLYNADTINKVLNHLMTYGIKVEGGDKVGKTIIFAKSHKHAVEIQKRFNQQYPQLGGEFLQIIDNYDRFAQDTLDKFSDPSKYPQIAVSVDMLDTGIDIHEIVNLVFFKPVYSSSKFWQMIGRGTRLCPDLFGPGVDKEHFCIFDFCGNFDFFDVNPEGIESKIPETLSQKIFNTRIQIAEALRDPKYQENYFIDQRIQYLDRSHHQVKLLFGRRDNFRIKSRLKYIDKFKNRDQWDDLKQADISDIITYISPLVELEEKDEFAKRFDLLMLRIQLSAIEGDPKAQGLINRVTDTASKLLSISNIPAVRQELETIKKVLAPEFWTKVDHQKIEEVRISLRSLVRLIKKEEMKIFYTDFQDSLTGVEDRDLVPTFTKMDTYRKRVEKYIEENKHHLTIQKLTRNEPITHHELLELERILFDGEERGTKEDFMEEMGTNQPLGVFIRSILGLDVNAAKKAFADFLSKGNLRADQITFIDNIIRHLTYNGTILKSMLVEPPFTDINDQGIFGVFEDEEVDKIISIIDGIDGNAVA